jgi:hypothetical protein
LRETFHFHEEDGFAIVLGESFNKGREARSEFVRTPGLLVARERRGSLTLSLVFLTVSERMTWEFMPS